MRMMSNSKDFRRNHLPEFRDLFTALFKIRDKEVTRRVIDAINGVCCHHRNVCDTSTQTDFESEFDNGIRLKRNSTDTESPRPITKKRRRNKKIPRVEKYDTQKDGFVNVLKNPEPPKNSKEDKPIDIPKLIDYFEMEDLDKVEADFLNQKELTKHDVVQQMAKEWEISERYVNGYYPIHQAIIEKNINQLKRQLYVFEKKNKNIDELLTANGESPIQLALKTNCFCNIIKILIEKKPDFYQIDKNGNTLIHLTLLNILDEDYKILLILLKEIDLKLLSKYNDDGLTALHIGVIHDKFYMCKTILEYINDKLEIKSIGLNITDENELNEIFIKTLNGLAFKKISKLNNKKYKIINQKDLKHGRTALFFALGNFKKPKLLYLLLVNYADPNIEDPSSTDCMAYAKDILEKINSGNQILAFLSYVSNYIDKCSKL